MGVYTSIFQGKPLPALKSLLASTHPGAHTVWKLWPPAQPFPLLSQLCMQPDRAVGAPPSSVLLLWPKSAALYSNPKVIKSKSSTTEYDPSVSKSQV